MCDRDLMRHLATRVKDFWLVCLVSRDEEIKRRVSKCKEVQIVIFFVGCSCVVLDSYIH